jgi:hypothetical protein
VKLRLATILAATLLSACSHKGEFVDEGGLGIYTVRSACPIAGIPAGTGDITLFDPAGSTDSRAIDVSAAISDIRPYCTEGASDVVSTTTFTVVALRRDAAQPRQVILPYFNIALQGGSNIAAKQIGQVVLNFPAGSVRAQTQVQATIRVNRSVATLPADVRQKLVKPRKSGQNDAAVDPLTDPTIREAVSKATFEHLIGFQLTQDQLRYNATR